VWINWVVAPRAGMLFAFMYQFWFTVFILVFLMENGLLIEALWQINDDVENERVPDKSLYLRCGISWALSAVMTLALSFWSPVSILVPTLIIMGLEALFVILLVLSASMPKESGSYCRLCQYAAGFVGLLQYGILPLQHEDDMFDGRTCIYFHCFKQMFLIGFIATIVRDKASKILSRIGPMVWVLSVFCTTTTNWHLSGVMTYPYFANLDERLFYNTGTWLRIFMVDRLSQMCAETQSLEALPWYLNIGGLLAYMFHPWVIVLLSFVSGLEDWPFLFVGILIGVFAFIAWLIQLALARKQR